MKKKKIRVIYIVGNGRSGSTLLERALGQIPGIEAVGELDYLPEIQIDKHLCGCGELFSECIFWSKVNFEGELGIKNCPLNRMKVLRDQLEKNINIPRFFINCHSSFDKSLLQYEEILNQLYSSIYKRSGNSIIIDSSKDVRRLFILNKMNNIELIVIHLIRNPRGVAYSWTKNYIRPEVTEGTEVMHQYHPARTAWRWLYKNTLISLSRPLFKKYKKVFYEDFINKSQQVIKSILSLLNYGYADLDFLSNKQLRIEQKTHTVSGNPGRFIEGTIKLKMDNEWEEFMPPLQKLIISLITWPLELIYFFDR